MSQSRRKGPRILVWPSPLRAPRLLCSASRTGEGAASLSSGQRGAPSVVTQRVAGLDLDLGSAGGRDPGSLVPCGPATFSLHLQGTPPFRPWRFWGPLCTPTGKKTQRSCLWFTPLVTPLHPNRRREALGQVVRLLERPKAFPRRWPEKQATVPMF